MSSRNQQTISAPMTVTPKLRQRERWGTPALVILYARRSRVEGTVGLLKNDATGKVKRGWTCQVGIIKTTLLLAVAVTSPHLRKMLSGSWDTGDVTDPLTRWRSYGRVRSDRLSHREHGDHRPAGGGLTRLHHSPEHTPPNSSSAPSPVGFHYCPEMAEWPAPAATPDPPGHEQTTAAPNIAKPPPVTVSGLWRGVS